MLCGRFVVEHEDMSALEGGNLGWEVGLIKGIPMSGGP